MYNANNPIHNIVIQCYTVKLYNKYCHDAQELILLSRNSKLIYLFLIRFSQKDCIDQQLHSYSVIFLKSQVKCKVVV